MTASDNIYTCVGCGCTDLRACPGGCRWVAVSPEHGTGVCSNCMDLLETWCDQLLETALAGLPDELMAVLKPEPAK